MALNRWENGLPVKKRLKICTAKILPENLSLAKLVPVTLHLFKLWKQLPVVQHCNDVLLSSNDNISLIQPIFVGIICDVSPDSLLAYCQMAKPCSVSSLVYSKSTFISQHMKSLLYRILNGSTKKPVA